MGNLAGTLSGIGPKTNSYTTQTNFCLWSSSEQLNKCCDIVCDIRGKGDKTKLGFFLHLFVLFRDSIGNFVPAL